MSVSTNKKFPTLRFPEFAGEWMEERLSHCIASLDAGVSVNSVDRAAKTSEYGILKTSCVTSGVFVSGENKLVKDPVEIHRLKEPVQANTIIISRMNTPELVGANARVKVDAPTLFLPDRLWAAKIKNISSVEWLSQLLSERGTRAAISARATGTSGSMKNVTKSDILTLPIYLPSLFEQTKLGTFFSEMDEKLERLQCKRDLLTDYKRSVMQKIFSNKIRFKADDGSDFPEWEEKQLGEVFLERSEREQEDKPLLSVGLNIGVVLANSLDRRDNSNSDKSNYKVVKKGDIAYNSMRMWQGASGLSVHDGIVSPAYTVVVPLDGQVGEFWGYYFKLKSTIQMFQRYSQGMTSDTWNLKFPAFSSISLSSPLPDEQKKIANFLSAIDAKIEAVLQQITQIEAFKKGLLQQMFM